MTEKVIQKKLPRGKFDMVSEKWDADTHQYNHAIFLNVVEMMRDRGYKIPSRFEKFKWKDYMKDYKEAYEKFLEHFQKIERRTGVHFVSAMSTIFEHGAPNDNRKTIVHFIPPPTNSTMLGKEKTINPFVVKTMKDLAAEEYNGIILAIPVKFSSKARESIHEIGEKLMLEQGVTLELIMWDFFHVHPKKIVNSAKYEAIPQTIQKPEAAEFFNRNGLKPDNIPQFYFNDPIAVWEGWKVGQLVYIEREDPHTNAICPRSAYYRMVSGHMTTK